jgi:hypothetical protein
MSGLNASDTQNGGNSLGDTFVGPPCDPLGDSFVGPFIGTGAGGIAVHHKTSLRFRRTAISTRSARAGLTHILDGYSRSSRVIVSIPAALSPD